jgi:branched-chain amino acid aminotransferase
MGSIYYLNGVYVREDEAKIPIVDLGVVRGYGIFDYLRTYRGVPFHLWEHLLRLKYSAEQIGLHLPNTMEEIEKIILKLLCENNFPESSIKIVVTGGLSSDHMMPEKNSTLMILVYPFKPFPEEFYTQGIRAITTPLFRPVPFAKTTHYIPAIMALHKAREVGAHEALYLNAEREVLEATTSNFFALKKGTLITPASEEILYGITREVILKIASCPVEIRPIRYEELASLDEAFISSSNREIMPISQIDDFCFELGPKTRELKEQFRNYTSQGSWEALKIPRYTAQV